MRIPIVDQDDNIIYYIDKENRKSEEIIRISGLCIFNEKGEVLLARRSKKERHYPDLWGPSITGGVEEGETYESNAIKEAEEEIGLILESVIPGPKRLLSHGHAFFAQWFFARVPSDAQFSLLDEEVDEVRWVPIADLRDWHFREPERFLPFFGHDIEIIEEYENKI